MFFVHVCVVQVLMTIFVSFRSVFTEPWLCTRVKLDKNAKDKQRPGTDAIRIKVPPSKPIKKQFIKYDGTNSPLLAFGLLSSSHMKTIRVVSR